MIQYRTFRNTDPPALVDLWNECFTGRGAANLRGSALLEYCIFAKPYFDPQGLILAAADNQLAGLVLAGFGPNTDGTGLDRSRGVTCLLGVRSAFRRQGIGSELLRRSEEYLRQRGAVELFAGPREPLNPFTFAIYGGSESAGFLESDPLARAFLERHGYRVQNTDLILQRSLEAPVNVVDARFGAYRQRYEIYASPVRAKSWWRECVLGLVELHEYRLQEKNTTTTVARLALWEMEPYGTRWNEHAIGMCDFEVIPERRRQALAKFFLGQVLRHLHEQFFTKLEVHASENNGAALKLLQLFGFSQVDKGFFYKRASLGQRVVTETRAPS